MAISQYQIRICEHQQWTNLYSIRCIFNAKEVLIASVYSACEIAVKGLLNSCKIYCNKFCCLSFPQKSLNAIK